MQGSHPILVLLVEQPSIDPEAQFVDVVPWTPAPAVVEPLSQR
jgi:hypothetical protein